MYTSFIMSFECVYAYGKASCYHPTGIADRNPPSIVGKLMKNFIFAVDSTRLPVPLYMHQERLDLQLEILFLEKCTFALGN